MNTLLEALNRLLAEALAGQSAQGTLRVRSVLLDEAGAHVTLQLHQPAGEGELLLRLQVHPPQGDQQRLVLTLERGPERWAPALEAFRRVLERARLTLELDFSEPGQAIRANSPSTPS